MTDRPILFSASMIRALLDGRKTQTRRMLRHPEYFGCPTGDCPHNYQAECNAAMAALSATDVGFAIGDRLWVKETWRTWRDYDALRPTFLPTDAPAFYEADRDNCDRHGKVRVSIHMPRWASRLTLTVTDVRVQRLQDCSEADAVDEGLLAGVFPGFWRNPSNLSVDCPNAVSAYAALWDSINSEPGKRWEDNPWIVVVGFECQRRNIDAGGQAA